MSCSRASDNKLTVIHKDTHLLVALKPSGMPSVPLAPDETGSAVSAAAAIDPWIARVGDRPLEGGLLHRLDTGTSGLLVFARTPEAFEFYRACWKHRRVQKHYRALIGLLEASPLWSALPPLAIDWPISRSAKSSRRMIVHVPGRRVPKSATRGTPLEAETIVHEIRWIGENRADVSVEILTGVMHQIRAHLSALAAPIMGDPIYGKSPAPRLMLHAWKLGLPRMNAPEETFWLEAPLPGEWP